MNTFKIDAKAKLYVAIESTQDFLELLQQDIFHDNKKLFLGGGSNILLTKDFDGLVIHNKIAGKKINGQNCHSVNITVGGGENRNELVLRSCENNYIGIENLVAIPGSVGASPIQNIGAYGSEVKDTIVKVGGIDVEKKQYRTLSNKECQFTYRSSIFKGELAGRFFVTDVTFVRKKLQVDTNGQTINYSPNIKYGAIQSALEAAGYDSKTIRPKHVVEIITAIRKSKLPDYEKIGTAGSFFKNPIISTNTLKKIHEIDPSIKHREHNKVAVKIPAGQLIENCGLKGYNNSKAGTYKNHALVLINYNNATGQDVIQCAKHIQQKVLHTYGIMLEPEVNYI